MLGLNIQGLSSKCDHLQTLLSELSDAHVEIDYILLCETLVNDDNAHLFKLPNYNFMYTKNRKIKGGVSIYIRDTIQYNLREYLSIS